MHWLIFKDEDRAPQQRITHVFVDPLSVDFLWNVGKDASGGVPYIAAPVSCIEKLIEKIEKGIKEGIVDCQESHPFANYSGAKISGQVVELNYDESTKHEILSVRSLLKIKRALRAQKTV